MRRVLRGGRVIDPIDDFDGIADVIVDDGVLARVVPSGDPEPYRPVAEDVVVDARGKLVVPGLVDFHTHVYKGVSSYGLDPDRAGVRAGVTHVNDQGSSGWLTIGGLQELVAPCAETSVTCFPNVLAFGLTENWGQAYPEMAAHMLETEPLLALGREDPELVRGIKLHLDRGLIEATGRSAAELLALAGDVSGALGLPLYVHLGDVFPCSGDGDPRVLPLEAIELLRPGDVLGHCFTPAPGGLVAADGSVSPAAQLASERGILLEVGHGVNFSFERAMRLLDAGVDPDIASSDLHGFAHCGRVDPAYPFACDVDAPALSWSMTGTMSKLLALGIELSEVIRMSSLAPARALGIEQRKAALTPGRVADITILDAAVGEFVLRDSIGTAHAADTLLLPAMTMIGDRVWECEPFSLPEFCNEYLQHNPDLV